MWRQYELWDGTYTLGDFLDLIEVLQVNDANQQRQQEWEEINAER